MVIRTSLDRDLKSALLVSLGGSLPELLYASIAIIGVSFLNQHPQLITTLNYLVIPVFLILGIYYISQKKKNKIYNEEKSVKSFSKGLLLATLNPQLLPFWFGILIYINSLVIINQPGEQFAFVIGTAFGAFVLLCIYAFIAYRKRELINSYISKFNYDKIIGWSFLALSGIKVISFIY